MMSEQQQAPVPFDRMPSYSGLAATEALGQAEWDQADTLPFRSCNCASTQYSSALIRPKGAHPAERGIVRLGSIGVAGFDLDQIRKLAGKEADAFMRKTEACSILGSNSSHSLFFLPCRKSTG